MRDRVDCGLATRPPVIFNIDAVCVTDSISACRDALRRAARDANGPVERHSARVFFIMDRLAQNAAIPLDREVAACAALLHDIGLYDPAARPRFYLRHGRAAASAVLESFNWGNDRRLRCLDAIELHHRLRPQWARGEETELLRLADLIDASRGLVTFGLERTWLQALFASISREGLQRELLRHSLRGAPCMTRGFIGTVINAARRKIPVRGAA